MVSFRLCRSWRSFVSRGTVLSRVDTERRDKNGILSALVPVLASAVEAAVVGAVVGEVARVVADCMSRQHE